MNGKIGSWISLSRFFCVVPSRVRNVDDDNGRKKSHYIPSMQSIQIVYGAELVLESI